MLGRAKGSAETRTFLGIDEFHALIDAAKELDAEALEDYRGIGRRAMIATLGLADLRISELLDLRIAHVDFARKRLRVADAKTEARVREVDMTLFLRDELVAHTLDREEIRKAVRSR
jgi:integrase